MREKKIRNVKIFLLLCVIVAICCPKEPKIYIPYVTAEKKSCISFSTYLGGSGFDSGWSLAIDEERACYVISCSSSDNFPIFDSIYPKNALYSDIIVTKFNCDGSLNFSRAIGGTKTDLGSSIALDEFDCYYLTGRTFSADFPIVNALNDTMTGNEDLFVTKCNPNGTIAFSTYFGGEDYDDVQEIAVDNKGATYITGYTESHNFPVLNAHDSTMNGRDCFLTKFNPDGSLNFSTYFGGNNSDIAWGIALHNDEIYLTGETYSSDFPELNPLYAYGGYLDFFLSKFSDNGTLKFSTYIGSKGFDHGYDVHVDEKGYIYLTGVADEEDFPIQNAFMSSPPSPTSGFVMKLNPDLSLNFSTFLGGGGSDEPQSISVNSHGLIFVTGFTRSGDFPVKNAIDPEISTFDSSFISIFHSNGSLNFSSFIDGDKRTESHCVASDDLNGCYITGETLADNFPVQNAYDSTLNGYVDVFVTKLQIGDYVCKEYSRINWTYIAIGGLVGLGVIISGTFILIKVVKKRKS